MIKFYLYLFTIFHQILLNFLQELMKLPLILNSFLIVKLIIANRKPNSPKNDNEHQISGKLQ